MKLATSGALLLLALYATQASGAGINLSLDDCGPFGGVNAAASCGTNTGIAMTLVGSVIPPAGVNRMVGMESYLDVRTEAGTLSPWWTLDGCRASALTFNFDFVSGPNSCNDFWAGQASGGGGISPWHASPDRFQIKLVCATVGENAIAPGVEHYLFKVNLLRSNSTGAGSCAGCDDGACFVLGKVILNQPAGVGDHTLTEASDRNWVTYNANPNLGECPGVPPPPPPPPPPAPPAAPLLATPVNGATGVAVDPTLTWNASAGATSYRLQVSTGVGFWTLLVDEPNLTATSFALSSLAENTAYYWRVNASNAGGTSSHSAIWSFTTISTQQPPPAPALATPVDGATGVATSPTLAWNASAGATSYRLQVSTDAGFAVLAVNQANIATTSRAVSLLAANTVHYWRVNASNAGGTSAYSDVWSFTTAPAVPPAPPVLAVPLDGATGVSTNPTLIWNASAGATSYRLVVSTDAGFAAVVLNQANIMATSRGLSSLAPNTNYYWHVNASNAEGTSEYSTAWSFTTAPPPQPPAPPVLATPVDGATGFPTTATFVWNASSGATWYRLQVSTDQGFGVLTVDRQNITTTSSSSFLAANTLYYWRVNASSTAGTSPYSTIWSFTTGAATPPPAPPAAPVLAAPANGATGVATNPTLSWNASAGAMAYRLQVSTDAGFATLVVNQANILTTSIALSALAANTVYYWQVNAGNIGGTSAYSATWSFTTGATAPPPTPPPTGPAYLNLALDDCGVAGSVDAAANCATNTGVALSIVGSVLPPSGMNRVVACEAYIDGLTSAAVLSPWWTLDGCRANALSFSFDFLAGPTSCHDFWAGLASGGGGVSPAHSAPNRFQIKLVCATVAENAISPGVEHYMFKVNITRAKSTGTNSCAGCGDAACFVLNRLVLNQPAGVGDYVVTTPLLRNFVTYASGFTGCASASPARNRSWGQVKALFR